MGLWAVGTGHWGASWACTVTVTLTLTVRSARPAQVRGVRGVRGVHGEGVAQWWREGGESSPRGHARAGEYGVRTG